VQDPYSIRCIPQVHGAAVDALAYVRRVLEVEVNSATDNPLIFADGAVVDPSAVATGGGHVVSGGNFHGQPIALAMDLLTIAVAELGSISERRIAQLVDARTSGLPAFLAAEPGQNSGMMVYQYAAAALVSENKSLAHPASVDSIPTSADQEDHVSMGPIAASPRPVGRRQRAARARRSSCCARARASTSGWPMHRRPARASRRLISDCARPLGISTPIARQASTSRPLLPSSNRAHWGSAASGAGLMVDVRIVDVGDADTFRLVPPCADPRFDHRSCDYWEDADRGS
jgi:hypothetical protein